MISVKDAYTIVPKNEKIEDAPEKTHEAPKGFGVRHTQILVLFICLAVAYALRAQLSVSMVAMTSHDFGHKTVTNNNSDVHNSSKLIFGNTSEAHNVNYTSVDNVERTAEGNDSIVAKNINLQIKYEGLSKWNVYRRYEWNKATQEMIMSSFFVGYTTMMLPMGCIAQKFGGKKPIMVAMAVNGVISLITPWVPIFGGWMAVCVCRFLQGATQATFYPSIHTFLGSQLGTVIIFQIAGVFAGSPSLGWPATFWLCGVLSFVAFGLLWWFGAATPHEHPSISEEEMTFIMDGGSADVVPKKRRTPWRSILTSKAVWAIVATQAGSNVVLFIVMTQTPTYMNFVLKVDIKNNGLFSSLPYVAMYCTSLMFGYLGDYVANKNIMSLLNIRRTANTIGVAVTGLCLAAFSFCTSTVPAVIMLALAMSLHSAVLSGFVINQIDITPNFAGLIMALGNMIGYLLSLLIPVVVSNILQDDMGNQKRWQIVFMIIAAIELISNAIFVIFAKTDVQPWNFYGEEDDTDPEMTDMDMIPEKNNSTNKKDVNFAKT